MWIWGRLSLAVVLSKPLDRILAGACKQESEKSETIAYVSLAIYSILYPTYKDSDEYVMAT